MSELLSTTISNVEHIEIIFRVKSKVSLICVRPHLMVQGVLQDGEVVLEVLEGTKVLSSVAQSYTLFNASKDDTENARGYYRFDTNVVLNHNTEEAYTEYKIILKMTNHTIDSSNFVSVLSDFNQVIDLHDDLSKAAYNIEFYTI